MTARGEAPPDRLRPTATGTNGTAGWTACGFFSVQILSPKARGAAAHGSARRSRGETRMGRRPHRLPPAKPRAISSFMISLVPP